MTITLVTTIQRFIGDSGDTKPPAPPTGSTFYEGDTGNTYIFNGASWVIKV
jgi:hypothetical protein